MNSIVAFLLIAVCCSGLKSAEEALISQQRLRITEAQLVVRIDFGYKGPWSASVKTPACSVLHATLLVLLSWKPSRVEIVFRDMEHRCEVEPGDVVNIVPVASSKIAHVMLRIGVGDAVNSREGSQYNALLLLHDDIQIRPHQAFNWDSLPLTLSNLQNSGRKVIDALFLCIDDDRATSSTSHPASISARRGIDFAHYEKVTASMPPGAVKLPLNGIRGASFIGSADMSNEGNALVAALNRTLLDGLLDSPWRIHVEKNLHILRNMTWVSYLSTRSEGSRKFQYQKEGARKMAAVIVEPRMLPTLEYSIRSTMHHLLSAPTSSKVQWKFRIYHSVGPGGNENFLRRVLADVPPALVKFLPLPPSFGSQGNGGSYNQLFKSDQFWKSFNAHRFNTVLIFQADSVVLDGSKLVSDFLHFDLIGAPWPVPTVSVWERTKFNDMCCNGGLSVRRAASMLDITSKKRSLNPAVNEDKYFSSYAREFKLQVPNQDQAEQFALEAPISNRTVKPVGLHAAWAYNDLETITSLLDEGMASLLRSREGLSK